MMVRTKDVTRADHEAEGRACERSPLCQIIGDHDGSCDPRTEMQRSCALIRHLDVIEGAGAEIDALEGMMEADARLHMAVSLAGGRSA